MDDRPRVVNVKVANIRPGHADLRVWMADENNVYVGRRGVVFVGGARWPPADSPWANPFKIGRDGDRAAVIERYRAYITDRVARGLTPPLATLRGKTLGCWCAPEACHADVLADLVAGHGA